MIVKLTKKLVELLQTLRCSRLDPVEFSLPPEAVKGRTQCEGGKAAGTGVAKADKAATYVLMDTSEYLEKIDTILNDTTKFKRINKDPTESLKKKISQLTFTTEDSVDGALPFLDLLVKQNEHAFNTTVYTKPTNPGHCLNGSSECPQRYKDSTISAYIRRVLTHCSTWEQVHNEIERSTQVLLNNGFSEKEISHQIKRIMDGWHKNNNNNQNKEKINIYYKSIFSSAYKEDERIMKQIIKRNIKPVNPEKILNLVIYYKTKKTSHLLIRNSPQQEKRELQKSHVIYRFNCTQGNCEALPSTYIGMATMRLSRRLSYHLTSGAPKNHLNEAHSITLSRENLEENTEILDLCTDDRRLPILEALYIKELSPDLNKQADDLRALPSMRQTGANPNTRHNTTNANMGQNTTSVNTRQNSATTHTRRLS
ncbi:uncharacterized protein LOC143031487 [Oratosquilla oratoria]|uniref:uncharacterized protein LOC143031487 n=1 Tax=Oratosquilla oratoria TaxID=337810 RepID=UPI003F75F4A4